ncbi:MAG: aldo/keto reductase [Alphaproteobacteria bacterium]
MRRIARRDFCAGALGAVAMTGLGLPGADAAPSLAPMVRRPIPKSGELLPVVGVGTWQTFDVGNDADDRVRLGQVLETLFGAGGTVIDTSPMYRRAEGVVGDLLARAGTRGKAFLATKVWTDGEAAGRGQMEQSLRRLRTDRIELMQVHNLVDWRIQLRTMRAWREAGRFRYLGITHYTPSAFDELEHVLRAEPLDFLQIPYSITVTEAESRLLPLARDLGVAVIANRPFEGGDLFGRTRGRPLPGFAPEIDCGSWAQFFLKYILGHDAMTCVIPGTDRVDHMADNAGAGRGRMPDTVTRKRMVDFLTRL